MGKSKPPNAKEKKKSRDPRPLTRPHQRKEGVNRKQRPLSTLRLIVLNNNSPIPRIVKNNQIVLVLGRWGRNIFGSLFALREIGMVFIVRAAFSARATDAVWRSDSVAFFAVGDSWCGGRRFGFSGNGWFLREVDGLGGGWEGSMGDLLAAVEGKCK